MRKLKDYLMISVKGACMGAADVIPGVSGGTIAFIMGIYDEFVGSIARIDSSAIKMLFKGRIREFWKHINGSFLLALVLGIGVSIVSLAGLMKTLLTDCPIQTWAFFFGLIVASSMFILRGISGWKLREAAFLTLGVVLGVIVCTLSPVHTPEALWFVFLSGAIAICAMILPGISGSFILLILGKYQFIMESINAFTGNLGFIWGAEGASATVFLEACLVLTVFACGAVIGILGFSKFLHWLLARWHKETLIVLAGFIIGSLVKVWPWSNTEAIVCSQFSKVAELRDIVENLQDAVAAGKAGAAELADATAQLSSAVDSHAHLISLHIGWAIAFALFGFFLVTGIETAGKIIAKKSQAQ